MLLTYFLLHNTISHLHSSLQQLLQRCLLPSFNRLWPKRQGGSRQLFHLGPHSRVAAALALRTRTEPEGPRHGGRDLPSPRNSKHASPLGPPGSQGGSSSSPFLPLLHSRLCASHELPQTPHEDRGLLLLLPASSRDGLGGKLWLPGAGLQLFCFTGRARLGSQGLLRPPSVFPAGGN